MVIEDFTDPSWIEVDPNNHIVIASPIHVDFDAYRNEDAHLYKDKGIDFFGDFVHFLDVKIPASVDSSVGYCWVLSNDIDDVKGLKDASKTAIGIYGRYITSSSPNWLFRIYETYGGSSWESSPFGISPNIQYYLRIEKIVTQLVLRVWTNSNDRDNNDIEAGSYIGSTSLDLQVDHKFRYVFVCNTLNSGHSIWIRFDIENLDLEGLPPPIPLALFQEEGSDFRETKFGATWP